MTTTSTFNYDQSLYDFLKDGLEKDRPALTFWGKTVKGRELLAYIADFAAFLAGYGVKRGDVVTLVLPNLPVSVVAFYAVSYLGGVISVLHPLTPRDKILSEMDKTGSKVVVAFDKLHFDWDPEGVRLLLVGAGAFRSKLFAKGVDIVNRVGKCLSPRYESMKHGFVPHESQTGEDVCLYLHSGGTTGEPKTVVLTCHALNASLPATVGINPPPTDHECMLMLLPLFHGFGVSVCMHAVLPYGVRIVPVPKFEPKRIARLLRRHHATLLAGVPALYSKLLSVGAFARKGLSLTTAYCGGDVLDPAIKREFDRRMQDLGLPCRLYQGWGLAEGVAVCCANSAVWGDKPGSIGRPVEGVDVLVWTGERIADPNEKGELLLAGETLMKGYLEGGERWVTVDGKRYLATGDVGYRDEDGWLYYVGRNKRMSVFAGVNVYHQEVEQQALALSSVKECAVVETVADGKPCLALYYVGEIDKSDLIAALSRTLNRYQLPRLIVRRAELPKTPTGKVDYRRCE